MKTDLYTKVILTIIAVCLSINVLQSWELIPTATADGMETNTIVVPLNPDGSIDVNVKTIMENMDVNIEEINGNSFYGSAIPVTANGELDVNIEEVGGYSVSNKLPVEQK